MRTAYLVIVDPNSTGGDIDVGYDLGGFKEVRRKQINYDDALTITQSFLALPDGGGDLCYLPVFAIELRDNDSVFWSGAACFDCGTYHATDCPGGSAFDHHSDAAKLLLSKLRKLEDNSKTL